MGFTPADEVPVHHRKIFSSEMAERLRSSSSTCSRMSMFLLYYYAFCALPIGLGRFEIKMYLFKMR